jgi:hypothetical protein
VCRRPQSRIRWKSPLRHFLSLNYFPRVRIDVLADSRPCEKDKKDAVAKCQQDWPCNNHDCRAWAMDRFAHFVLILDHAPAWRQNNSWDLEHNAKTPGRSATEPQPKDFHRRKRRGGKMWLPMMMRTRRENASHKFKLGCGSFRVPAAGRFAGDGRSPKPHCSVLPEEERTWTCQ